jgi:hypothetical protein
VVLHQHDKTEQRLLWLMPLYGNEQPGVRAFRDNETRPVTN